MTTDTSAVGGVIPQSSFTTGPLAQAPPFAGAGFTGFTVQILGLEPASRNIVGNNPSMSVVTGDALSPFAHAMAAMGAAHGSAATASTTASHNPAQPMIAS